MRTRRPGREPASRPPVPAATPTGTPLKGLPWAPPTRRVPAPRRLRLCREPRSARPEDLERRLLSWGGGDAQARRGSSVRQALQVGPRTGSDSRLALRLRARAAGARSLAGGRRSLLGRRRWPGQRFPRPRAVLPSTVEAELGLCPPQAGRVRPANRPRPSGLVCWRSSLCCLLPSRPALRFPGGCRDQPTAQKGRDGLVCAGMDALARGKGEGPQPGKARREGTPKAGAQAGVERPDPRFGLRPK